MNNQYYIPYYNNIPIYPNNLSGFRSINPGYAQRGLLSSLAGKGSATAIGTKTFSFNNLLNGASKTLGVINQAIPVVYQVKPIWNNAKTMFKVAKEMRNDSKPNSKESNNKTTTNNSIKNNNNSNNNKNTPQFFI